MTKEEKLALLEKMGLKPSIAFGEVREQVWRPKKGGRSYLSSRVQGRWKDYDGISDDSLRKYEQMKRKGGY